jgi:hypothetical protein
VQRTWLHPHFSPAWREAARGRQRLAWRTMLCRMLERVEMRDVQDRSDVADAEPWPALTLSPSSCARAWPRGDQPRPSSSSRSERVRSGYAPCAARCTARAAISADALDLAKVRVDETCSR